MPQRKGRQTNKKKNKGRGGQGPGPRRPPGWTDRPNTNGESFSSGSFLQSASSGGTPNLDGLAERRRKSLQKDFPSLYSRYKDATKRFVHYMINAVPNSIEGNRNSVHFLVTAAEWMEGAGFQIETSILRSLKLAIRMRSKVAKSIYGDGDVGHRHFLLVLQYCWQVLSSLPKSETSKHIIVEEEAAAEENRFAALMEEDDILEEVQDEDAFPTSPVPRPEMETDIPLTIDELLRSDERNDCVLFLMTLDELMAYISDQYQAVMKNYANNKATGVPESNILEILLEAAVSTNMAIQQVQQLEMDLQVQYSHLTTPYRVLSTIVLPEITKQVAEIVREHGSSTQGLEKEIIIFLGDCLECHMRAPSDPHNKRGTIVRDFCSKFKVNSAGRSELDQLFRGLNITCMCELPISTEHQEVARMQKAARSIGGENALPPSHSWLPQMNFIGGDRAIHHTLRLLQGFGPVISKNADNQAITPIKGFFGPSPWRPGRAQKIHGDLDELLMADIMPKLVLLAKQGILGKVRFPRESELYPLFILLRDYVQRPSAPVSWSFTFAIHAMMTAVLETDKVFNQLLDISSSLFQRFFDQANKAAVILKKESSSEMLKNPAFAQNFTILFYLENFGNENFGKRAVWNPLCAGTIFSVLNFFGNVEAGCCIIDSQAQLRITLHLFNALKERGLIKEGDVPVLDIIDDCFKSSRGVWEGPKPKQGEFVQRFWICFGSSVAHAKRMAEEAKLLVQHCQMSASTDKSWGKRKMKPIEPADIAKSFRRICNRDFHDVVDKYHTDEQRKRGKGTDMYAFAVRANDTLDAIDEDQKLFALNLPVLGILIEQFVCSLGRVLQWEPLLKEGSASLDEPERQGFAVLYAQHLLGALDFADDLSTHAFLGQQIGMTSSGFLQMFFNNLNRELVMWFQAVQEED
jgi:hypothetical protein